MCELQSFKCYLLSIVQLNIPTWKYSTKTCIYILVTYIYIYLYIVVETTTTGILLCIYDYSNRSMDWTDHFPRLIPAWANNDYKLELKIDLIC